MKEFLVKSKGRIVNILEKAGLASFGKQWQTAMSKVLNVNARTVRRWASGETPLPATLKHELLKHLKCRKRDMDKAMIDICDVSDRIIINDITFYQTKGKAMTECLRKHKVSEFLDRDASIKSGKRVFSGRVLMPHFAVIEWNGLQFYAMKFDEIDSQKVIKSDKLHSDTRWHLFEFDGAQASVVK